MFEEWQATAIGSEKTEPVSVPGTPAGLAGSEAVRYKTRFPDPRDGDDDVAVLELRGLYAHAELEATGDRADGEGPVEHDAYFAPLGVPFVPYEDNELVVTCHAPRDRFGGLHDTDLVPEEGRVPGIWWDATLSSAPLPYVEDVAVRPELTGDGARLRVRTTVVADEALSERITYSVKPAGDSRRAGMMERATVETDGPGRTTVEHEVTVRDPALWWPRGLGEQNRYTLRAKLDDSELSVTTGICDVGFEDGHLVVNDEPLPVRGVNLLTADPADVERALELNATLVRAHAHVLPPACYELCDREGLLVWQDMPLTGPGGFDADRGARLADLLTREYSRHPSLAVYGVHDDPVDPPDDLGNGFLDRLRLRWRTWRAEYDATGAEEIAGVLPDDRPVFPVVAAPGVDADAGSYYPGWDYGDADDIDDLLDRYPVDVVAEFGAGALAGDAVTDAAGFDRDRHDRRVSESAESGTYQAEVLRTVTEHLRRAGVGAIAFALRDTDRAGMGVYARDGTPKAGADALAEAFEPVRAFLADPSPGESDVVVVNDRPRPLSTTVSWRAGDEGGELDATVNTSGRWTGGPVTLPDGGTVELVVPVEDRQVETTYDL